jgi:hypothetical protein
MCGSARQSYSRFRFFLTSNAAWGYTTADMELRSTRFGLGRLFRVMLVLASFRAVSTGGTIHVDPKADVHSTAVLMGM